MGSFVVDFLLDAAYSGVLDCAMTTVHCTLSAMPRSCDRLNRRQKLQRESRTVEQRIVGYPDTASNQDQSSNATKETFWRATSGSSESRGSFREFVLDACPRFFGVRSRHYGGNAVASWRGVGETCRRQRATMAEQ
jgi:hypothetical protein